MSFVLCEAFLFLLSRMSGRLDLEKCFDEF